MTSYWNEDPNEGGPMNENKSVKIIVTVCGIIAVVVLCMLLYGCESTTNPGTTIGGFTVSYADSWSIQVNDQSVNSRSWAYDFGDGGGRSTERNPFHSYFSTATIRGCDTNEPCSYVINQTACPGSDGNYNSLDCQRESVRVVIPEPR